MRSGGSVPTEFKVFGNVHRCSSKFQLAKLSEGPMDKSGIHIMKYNKKEQATDTCNTVNDEHPKHYGE